MGIKQFSERKHLFIYLTYFLIILLCFGCTTIRQRKKHVPVNINAIKSKGNIYNGNFKYSLEMHEITLNSCPKSLRDKGLYEFGLFWSHPDNPKKNYTEAIKYFKKIIRFYPNSNFQEQSVIWISAINAIIQRDKKNLALTHNIDLLKNNDLNNKQKIKVLMTQIKELKEIDIGIEAKKRAVSIAN